MNGSRGRSKPIALVEPERLTSGPGAADGGNVLLFDRLVLPAPDGAVEAKRFAEADWEPGLQSLRGIQLDLLIHFVEWNEDLKTRWAQGMARWHRRLGPIAKQVEGLGSMETPR